ncbi:MAG TPA: M48 family metalloprotease [Nevskiaceae bacterium]|nr:M48 family metalloprotease [Nevskiaceae bacterium]
MSRLLTALLTSMCLVSAFVAATAGAEPPAQVVPTSTEFPTGAPAVIDLPQIGDPADTALSPAEENALGARVVSEMYRYEFILEDVELQDYLSTLGWRLAAASGTNRSKFEFFFVKDPRINAFALPGGYIGFNAGLLLAADTESEVAGVMAHELAHVTQRHIARSQAESGGMATIATWAAVLAAIIAGSADPDVVLAALSIGQASAYERQVSYTRAHEIEADRIGINTLSEGGFDPEAMGSFFQKLEQQTRLYGSQIPDILRTHPVNTTRVAEARSRAANMPKRPVQNSIEFGLMKARTQVYAANQPSDAVEAFSAIMASGKDKDTIANRYGLAYALHELGQNDRAKQVLQPALDRNPRQPNLNLLMAAIQSDGEDADKGLAIYQRTLALYPQFAPAILEYAEALIRAGQPELARQVLLSHEQHLGTRLDTYRLLAQAAREMDNDAEASYQMATYLYLRGDAGGALSQLDAGLRIASLTPQDRARLAARRAEVRESLPRNYELEPRRDRTRY